MRFPGTKLIVSVSVVGSLALLSSCSGGSGGTTPGPNTSVNATAPSTQPAGNVTLALAPTQITVAPGLNKNLSVAVGGQGVSGPVTITVTGLPPGVTVSPVPLVVSPGSAGALTFSAAPNAAVGAASVTIQGAASTAQAQTTIPVTVGPAPTVTLSLSPSQIIVAPGVNENLSVAVGGQDVSDSVAITVTGLPSGVTVSPVPLVISPGSAGALTFSASSNAVVEAGSVTIQGVASAAQAQTTIPVIIGPAPTVMLSLSPSQITVAPGVNENLSVAVGGQGVSGPVAITVTGLPSGVTVSPVPLVVSLGSAGALTFSAVSNATVGAASITIQGTASAAQAQTTASLLIGPGRRFNVQDAAYSPLGSAGHGGCVTDASITTGSGTVNSASLANATYPPQVGWIAWVLHTNSTGGACHTGPSQQGVTSTVRIGAAATTITQVNSATSVTLSNSAALNESGDVLFFGPDDYAPLSAACAAAGSANGGTVYAPSGIYLAGANTGNNPWCLAASTVKQSFALIGDGQDATLFFTAPWYNHTFNFGSVFALYAAPYDYASGWTLDGGGFRSVYGPDTPFEPAGPRVDHVTVQNYDLTVGSTELIYFSGRGGPGYSHYVNNSKFIASGTNMTACAVSGPYAVDFDNTICSSPRAPFELTGNGGGATVNVVGGQYLMAGNNFRGAVLLPQGGTPINSKIMFTNSTICDETGGSSAIVENAASFVLTLIGTTVNDSVACNGSVSGNTTALQVSAGMAILQNSTLAATGTGDTIDNSGTVIDQCGNTVSGGAGTTGAGVWQGSCSSMGILEQSAMEAPASLQDAAVTGTLSGAVRGDGAEDYALE